MFKKCRVSKRCRFCNKPHHSTLHEAPPETRMLHSKDAASKSNVPTSQPSSHFVHSHHHHIPVLLATALVRIVSPRGDSIIVRALIDQGSEVSFIGETLVQRLHLQRRSASIPITGIGSKRTCVSNGVVSMQLFSRLNPFISFEEETLIIPKLTSYVPQKCTDRLPSELSDLPLADPEFTSDRKIDLILGVRFYSKIIQSGVRKSTDGLLIAQQTALGWVLSGALSNQPSSHVGAYGYQCSIDLEFLDIMQRFWKQEDDTLNVSRLSSDERECEEHFNRTHQRDSDGRFVVRLPFRESPNKLGNSYSVAVGSFQRLELRFARNEQLRIEYGNFMREYLSLGHMRQVPVTLSSPNYYLPHNGVVRETSSTTRLTETTKRIDRCFDAMETTPSGFACDLEKMYRQIKVHNDDLPFQRIVWREDATEDLQSFELTTVSYGLSCAPYLAIRCIRQIADEHSSSQPLGTTVLLRDTYVDDILSGANDIDDVQEVIFQLNQVLKAGGFKARKWTSNHSESLTNLSPELIAKSNTLDIDNDHSPCALGLLWDNVDDQFLFRLNDFREFSGQVTKRSVLSFIARLFDPLGWLSPLIVTAKIFMQDLWIRKLDWDESLPNDLALKWISFLNDIRTIPAIRVPRWLGIEQNVTSIELHGFADASNAAFGAVVYLRAFGDSDVRVSIISSKTKVAPLKTVTIPRLELCAAVLLVRLVRRVIRALDLQSVPVHLWSDSTVALSWICSHPGRWKDFVRNRIIDLPQAKWSYVPSQDNPADLASRGVPIRQLQGETLWWTGPSWLSLPSSYWPCIRPTISSEADRERRRSIPVTHTASPEHGWNLKNKYSTLNKLLRITAWCFKYFKKSKSCSVVGILTPDEINHAMMFWVHECQQLYFPNEIRTLQDGQTIQRSSPLYKLTPFLDGEGFLRVTGRLRFASLDWDEKHPLILPKESRITSLVIDSHRRGTLHGGTQLTLSSLRRRFWIVGGRVPVRSFIQRCIICARHRVEASQQLMGQLPPSRVTPSRPFTHTGVDYAGPFQLRTFRGRNATSAIHLEISTDYTTSGFLAAYKRFSGRRGLCRCLYSDCGTNLIGADRELRSLFSAASKEWRHIAGVLGDDGTQWRFNPPAAPHFGGKWEAGVRSVKTHLKKIVGSTLLTYEEFSTVLIQIEAVLNSRPLCSLSEDPNNYEALTPAHFLVGSALNVVPEPSLADENMS
ncbi:uncharacterized protein [Onthophagus taurus]|uniref:uncharacterized protein n=1 Tax=Onthophagus taurus TaxID=166361 RepID=UPI0039BE5497